jgi:hypothetical protein
MRYLTMLVTTEVPEEQDHHEVMQEMLEQIPGDGHFADVSWTLDGTHIDEEGDPL